MGEDMAIVRQVLGGDVDAFRVLVERHQAGPDVGAAPPELLLELAYGPAALFEDLERPDDAALVVQVDALGCGRVDSREPRVERREARLACLVLETCAEVLVRSRPRVRPQRE